MLVGTHALLPVCACLIAENLAARAGREPVLPPRSLWVIGAFGVLPDICTPHLDLADRYASWSHTLFFMAGLLPVAAMAGSFFPKGARWRVALVCWLACALHLAADALSGGIKWLYPWRDEVIGRYYIPAQYWHAWDAFFILFAWFLIRVLPHMEGRGIRSARTAENSDTLP